MRPQSLSKVTSSRATASPRARSSCSGTSPPGGNLFNVGAAGGGSLIVPTFGKAFLSVGGDIVAPGGRIAVGESMPGKDYAGGADIGGKVTG